MTASNVAMIDDFNPRSHEGSDEAIDEYQAARLLFQSTLPRGERPALANDELTANDFNPRSHEGSDIPLRKSLI